MKARRDGSPLLASVRIAQNILETGCNLNEHNNLGGFKVGSGAPNQWWKGKTYTTPTWEVINGQRIQTVATWRSYDSVYDFYRDQDRLFGNERYGRVRAAKTPLTQCQALYACGYATDPEYAEKLMAIISGDKLNQYDREDETLELSVYQWGVLEAGVKALLDRGVIKDKSWMDKVKAKTLTTSDLSWLTFVVATK
jgi:flagellar protein FlgJ